MDIERGKQFHSLRFPPTGAEKEQSYIYFMVATLLVIGIAFVAFAASRIPDGQLSIWPEVAKSGLQLVLVAGIGGIVAAALRRLEAIREERRRLGDYLLTLLRDVVSAYNEIKATRRVLRAFGFRNPPDGPIHQQQLAEFIAQMRSLNQAQLSLERIARELHSHPLFLDSTCLQAAVRSAEKYVGRVLTDWERHGAAILVGADFSTLRELGHLHAFLESSAQGFEDGVATPMDTLQTEIRARLVSAIGPSSGAA